MEDLHHAAEFGGGEWIGRLVRRDEVNARAAKPETEPVRERRWQETLERDRGRDRKRLDASPGLSAALAPRGDF